MFIVISPGWQSLGSRSCRRRCHQPGPAGLQVCGDPVRSRELPGGLWIAPCWWSPSSLGRTGNKSRENLIWPISWREHDCRWNVIGQTCGGTTIKMSYNHSIYQLTQCSSACWWPAGSPLLCFVSIVSIFTVQDETKKFRTDLNQWSQSFSSLLSFLDEARTEEASEYN